jgi:hypothetical protein
MSKEFELGDHVISKRHTRPSPIWKIARLDPLKYSDKVMAHLKLFHPQGWGPGPIKTRNIEVDQLEHANAMLVIALSVEDYKSSLSQHVKQLDIC